jgi:ABC-type glutathione transport system ATPase component
VADQQPHEVAAGLRRRTALCGALAVDTPLYVLDDLDGAIDVTHRDIIVRALLDTHERTGATMLIATHDIELARAVADRMAVLAGGRIVFHGDPEEALARLAQWYAQEDEDDLRTPAIPQARQPSEPRRAAAPTERVTPKETRTTILPTVATVLVFVFLLALFLLAIPKL